MLEHVSPVPEFERVVYRRKPDSDVRGDESGDIASDRMDKPDRWPATELAGGMVAAVAVVEG